MIDTNIINKDNDNTIRTDSNMINNQEPLKISSDSGKLYLFTKIIAKSHMDKLLNF